MSEPIKKPSQTPDSYNPKKPEILKLVNELQGEISMTNSENAAAIVKFEIIEMPELLVVGKKIINYPVIQGESVPATAVGIWPLAAGTYDPALDELGLTDGLRVYGLFGANYIKYNTPINISDFITVPTIADLTNDTYCVIHASSGFDYVIVKTNETVDVIARTKPEPLTLKQLWDRCAAEKIFQTLEKQDGFVYDCSGAGFRYGGTDNEYIVGLLMKPGAEVPDGFSSHVINPGKVALCWVQGKNMYDIISNTDNLVTKTFKSAGVERNSEWSAELYNQERSGFPKVENKEISGSGIIIDWYLPLKEV